MSHNVNYTLTDIAMWKVQENALLVNFENDRDDGNSFLRRSG